MHTTTPWLTVSDTWRHRSVSTDLLFPQENRSTSHWNCILITAHTHTHTPVFNNKVKLPTVTNYDSSQEPLWAAGGKFKLRRSQVAAGGNSVTGLKTAFISRKYVAPAWTVPVTLTLGGCTAMHIRRHRGWWCSDSKVVPLITAQPCRLTNDGAPSGLEKSRTFSDFLLFVFFAFRIILFFFTPSTGGGGNQARTVGNSIAGSLLDLGSQTPGSWDRSGSLVP